MAHFAKSLFGLAIVSLVGSAALADCKTLEAQFIGTVSAVLIKDENLCRYSVSFQEKNSLFNPHFLCPLDIEDVNNNGVFVEKQAPLFNCALNVGDSISGVLVQKTDSTDSRVFLEQ